MKQPAYRHELKYLINMQDYALLRMRLMPVLGHDRNAGADGEYWIRSLYFDDYWDTAYEEKDLGILLRKKYRIRIYNCSDRVIRLERKSKYGAYIYKESAPLTRAEACAIIEGDYGFLKRSKHNLLREMYYECTSRILRPRVVVDYDREPFTMDEGEVRVTFDKHVRAGMGSFDIFDAKMPTVEVLEADRMIMEVKFTSFLPKLVRRLLPPDASQMTAASKFVMCSDAAVREKDHNRVEGLQWKRR